MKFHYEQSYNNYAYNTFVHVHVPVKHKNELDSVSQ